MRVCFISHTAGKGGAELALVELLQGLVAEGVECRVLVPKKGPLLTSLDRIHIKWKIIGYPRWMASTRHQWLVGRIRRTIQALLLAIPMALIIKKWQCDVVCSNTVAIGAGAFAARLARRPHIWYLHEFAYRDSNLRFDLGKRWTTCLMDRLSTFFIANSYAVAKDYAQYINQQKIYVIYQAVTLPDEVKTSRLQSNADRSIFRCVMVGSLHIAKGQDEAIMGLAELVRRGVNAELLLVGDGGRRFCEKLRQQVKALNLEQRVKFIGYVEDPAQFVRIADVVLVCSRWEAFGRATVEAMLAGKPVIGTANSGGTVELIQDRKTGFLYEAGNHVELANKMQYLYENPKERSRLGATARAWAMDRFTQKRYANEVLDVLNEVLTKEKTSSQAPSN